MMMVSTCMCYDFLSGHVCMGPLLYRSFPSELIVRWAQDFYEFQECDKATVELVTDSDFEAASVAISGRPRRIPDSDPSTRPSLEVPGPDIIPGN